MNKLRIRIILIFVLMLPFLPINSKMLWSFSSLKDIIQEELDNNPFLKREDIKLEVIDETNGYITIEMYEGNRAVRGALYEGANIEQILSLTSWGVPSEDARAAKALYAAIKYIRRIKGVKSILLNGRINTPLDRAILLFKDNNYDDAYKLFKQSAEEGSAKAQAYLGNMYSEGRGIDQNFELAIYWLLKSAKQGNSFAQNSLAWVYATAENPEFQNGEKAVEYALKASSQNPKAWYFHGTLAAAYARNGQFQDAIRSQETAIDLMMKSKVSDKKALEAEKRLYLYKNSIAYTEIDDQKTSSHPMPLCGIDDHWMKYAIYWMWFKPTIEYDIANIDRSIQKTMDKNKYYNDLLTIAKSFFLAESAYGPKTTLELLTGSLSTVAFASEILDLNDYMPIVISSFSTALKTLAKPTPETVAAYVATNTISTVNNLISAWSINSKRKKFETMSGIRDILHDYYYSCGDWNYIKSKYNISDPFDSCGEDILSCLTVQYLRKNNFFADVNLINRINHEIITSTSLIEKKLKLASAEIQNRSTDIPMQTLDIKSRPENAEVFVDGKLLGKTPLMVKIPLGKREILLSLANHYDMRVQIELIERNETRPLFFRLQAKE